jgi:hypothetical protein
MKARFIIESISPIFKPKDFNVLLNNIVNEVMSECTKYAACFYFDHSIPKIDKKASTENFFNLLHKQFGFGLFISVSDNDMQIAKTIISEITPNYDKVGKWTFKVTNEPYVVEKQIIKMFCQQILNRDIDYIYLKIF